MSEYQAIYDAANLNFGGFSYIPQHIQQEIYRVSEALTKPHVVMRPKISRDGDQWCAMYGEDIQESVAGFGDSPDSAMDDFDRNWFAKLPKDTSHD